MPLRAGAFPRVAAALLACSGALAGTTALPRAVSFGAPRSVLGSMGDRQGGRLMLATLLPLDSIAPPARGPRPKATPRVRIEVIEVGGGFSRELVRGILRQRAGRFRRCHESGARRDPNLRGTVEVRFAVDPKGYASDIRSERSSVADRAVVDCLIEGFRWLSFPKPEGGPAEVLVELWLTPGE